MTVNIFSPFYFQNIFFYVFKPTPPAGSFNVRISGYHRVRQLMRTNNAQLTGATSEDFQRPYEWSQIVTTNGPSGPPISSMTIASLGVGSDQATFITIEVPDGKAIRYEFNIPGRSVAAGNVSPRLSGFNVFDWMPGATISIVDAAQFP